MDPRHRPLFVDARLADKDMCVYCGADYADTRDHVPSKVLLDEPYPEALPAVAACAACNWSFSLDEQYLACFIECVVRGTAQPCGLQRAKVQRVLCDNPSLQQLIERCQKTLGGDLIWFPDLDRVRNVVLKLARGHAAYELYPQLEDPNAVWFTPLLTFDQAERREFENVISSGPLGWPEIGTRAFYRASGDLPDKFQQSGDWVLVQPGRYRYAVYDAHGVSVKMVLSEYLACEIIWE